MLCLLPVLHVVVISDEFDCQGLGASFYTHKGTLKEEMTRDIDWVDWKGVKYKLRQCWDYVKGAAVRADGCTPGF